MTVPDQTPQNVHTANGATTTFAYQFKILDTDHLEVYLNDVLQTSGYTVTGEGVNAGGTVVFTTAPAADTEVILIRSMTIERTAYDYQNAGDFLAATVNEDFDAAIMITQQINNTVEQRALLFPKTLDRSSNTNALPEPEEGRVLYWASGEIQNGLLNSLANNVTFSSELVTYDTMAQAIADADLTVTKKLLVKDRANSTWDLSSSGTANGYDVIFLAASGLYATLRLDNGNTSFRALGAVGDGATDTDALLSAANTLLSDGATLYGHPDDDYLFSGIQVITKAITIDMRGGTISSAALSNSAISFSNVNGQVINAVMDNVYISWSGSSVTFGKAYRCRFINQTYSNTTATSNAQGVVIDSCYFTGRARGPSSSATYPCFQITTGAGRCKFINNHCYDVECGLTSDGISAYSDNLIVSGNTFETLQYYALKTDVGNFFIFENNKVKSALYGIFYEAFHTDGVTYGSLSGNQVIAERNYFDAVTSCFYCTAATSKKIRGVFSNNYMTGCTYGVHRAVGHLLISGNHFYNGVALYYCGTYDQICSWNVTIESNVIEESGDTSSLGNDTHGTPITGSIIVSSLDDGSTYLTSILIRNNKFINYKKNGIMVPMIGSNHPRLIIINNYFENGANSQHCMSLGASRNLILKDNIQLNAPTIAEVFFPRMDRHAGTVQYENNQWQLATAAPTTKTWLLGSQFRHSSPASSGNIGWVNVFSFSTTLTATEPNTETSMAVTSGTGTANGDIIGVMLDSGSIHWTTISSGGGTTTIVLTSGITGQATSGNRVYVFRWKSYGTIA